MMVSIYDVTPQVQSFLPADDSFALLQATPGICGDKIYTSSEPLAVVVAPASGLLNTDLWTISSMTNDIALVGTYIVTVTVDLVNYPSPTPLIVTFTLTVYDPCETAVLDTVGQSLTPVSYLVMLAPGPSTTTFIPFTDNVATAYANPAICGPRIYTIVEAHPFVTLIPPAVGMEFTDPWTISVETPNIPDVGVYTTTI